MRPLGSDLMVFGTEGGPMLSLKLQEATKPMNAVTCLDYWLDNVMAGAPEVSFFLPSVPLVISLLTNYFSSTVFSTAGHLLP